MKFKLKNVKRKQALVTLALISWLAKLVKGSVKCANSQVTLNGECVGKYFFSLLTLFRLQRPILRLHTVQL